MSNFGIGAPSPRPPPNPLRTSAERAISSTSYSMPGVMAHSYTRRLKKPRANSGNGDAIINSAALQQSLASSLNLNAQTRSFRRRSRNRTGPATTQASASTPAPSSWTCGSCTLVNRMGTSSCDACAAPYVSNENTGEMPANHNRLNLAQLRGLEETPKSKLTAAEWTNVEYDALLRGDVTGVCSICHEDLVVSGGGGGGGAGAGHPLLQSYLPCRLHSQLREVSPHQGEDMPDV